VALLEVVVVRVVWVGERGAARGARGEEVGLGACREV